MTETKVMKVFQKVPFRSVTDIQKEKARAVVERVSKARQQAVFESQLRVAKTEEVRSQPTKQ